MLVNLCNLLQQFCFHDNFVQFQRFSFLMFLGSFQLPCLKYNMSLHVFTTFQLLVAGRSESIGGVGLLTAWVAAFPLQKELLLPRKVAF